MVQSRKVVIIGLDGADWRLVTPWIEKGHLPTLARLVSEGASGRLRSTIRPESSVAWSSFSTGVNPGKHGVFGFLEYVGQSQRFSPANGASVRVKRFWDLLGEQGREVGLLNIPFTYPPVPVHGFMISGMLTPDTNAAFTYPPQLKHKLMDRFGDYVLDAHPSGLNKASLVEHVRGHSLQQRDIALHLLREEPWDFFGMVFTGPDRLQHFLWADMDPLHPMHDPATASHLGQELLRHYQFLDDALARILDCLPTEALLILASDHGFNGCAMRFHVNHWLRDHGLLGLSRARHWTPGFAPPLARLKSAPTLRRLGRIVTRGKWTSSALRSREFVQAIDWPTTRAFFGLDGGLRINLRGREPNGIVSPDKEYENLRQILCEELTLVRDPKTGQRPIRKVFLREELYHGPYLEQAPDLILEPHRENQDPAANFVLDTSIRSDRPNPFGTSSPYTANHTLDGVLLMWGGGVLRNTQIANAEITDLAPTILAVMDAKIPSHMDGRVISEAFKPALMPSTHLVVDSDLAISDRSDEMFSPEEEIEIESRLRGLGYLD